MAANCAGSSRGLLLLAIVVAVVAIIFALIVISFYLSQSRLTHDAFDVLVQVATA